MELQEFCKVRNRMCEYYICYKCPMNQTGNHEPCINWCYKNLTKASTIAKEWEKIHPPTTNIDKFKEVFGLNVKGFEATPEWWEAEYKKPEEG